MLFGGVAFGSIGDDVADLIGDSEFSKDVFGWPVARWSTRSMRRWR